MACLQVKLRIAISQRFRKRTWYLKALYKCPGLLYFLLTNSGIPSGESEMDICPSRDDDRPQTAALYRNVGERHFCSLDIPFMLPNQQRQSTEGE